MNVDQQNTNQVIFQERIPVKLMTCDADSIPLLILCQWFGRLLCGFIIIFTIEELTLGMTGAAGIELMVISTAIPFLLIATEYLFGNDIKFASPIVIYSEQMKIYRTGLEMVFGRKRWIAKNDIDNVEVERRNIVQNRRGGSDLLTWRKAPCQLIINFKNGEKFKTGYKYPRK